MIFSTKMQKGPHHCVAPVLILWVGRRLVLQSLRDDKWFVDHLVYRGNGTG